MLSYQHGYHAGNLADVHKHALLAAVLSYLTRKDKPLSYFESHAGRGLYDLAAPEAIKTGEAAAGIARAGALLPADHPYRACLAALRARHGATAYPGSPLIAAHLLRPTDTIHLAELHPAEHRALSDVMAGTGAHVVREDGLAFAVSRLPPMPRRGMLLIDPSFEVKDDYMSLARLLPQLHAKWNVGILMLWYPILADGRHRPMLSALRRALPGTLVHEVGFAPMRPGHGMTGSGVVLVNPPFGIEKETALLDGLFEKLR
ncbi:23S rRNA (adenine(2030)-N(6))-methyltransferase RlmJ [Oceaniglobus roseus]|uniref:23S rRNA (adenine(2030)-N(6))-methyltransferase RlmJ n=1 Tax=Oceaniglobus roseus TaxID=1737570 RepID=UPI000C7F6E13|nr:23S rRNA (adenine(2030)-N(6))-methyltransferase RlmJ [Kandeliimicrobium roseum]